MATIHFLNVKQGDCSIINHDSGRVTVIDVCNAKPPDVHAEIGIVVRAQLEKGLNGNFQQKNIQSILSVTCGITRSTEFSGMFRPIPTWITWMG